MWVITLKKFSRTRLIISKTTSIVKTYLMPKLIWPYRVALREIAMVTFYQAPFKMEEAHIFLLQIEEETMASRNKSALKVWHPETPSFQQLQATVHLRLEDLL
jgi:hypothetical protein